VKAIYFEARRRGEADRKPYLERACADEPALALEVETLLAAGGAHAGFLESPAIDDDGYRAVIAESLAWHGEGGAPPERIGRYRVIRCIGEGGMGRLYEAEQESPRRRVALKVIRAPLLTRNGLRRFEQEVQILGRLRHPGIAQIFEAGVAHVDVPCGEPVRVPYFAMEFIQGVSLTQFAAARALSTSARIELVARICDAVHFGHQRGVIHRDLKPSNVLVEDGASDGEAQPRVIDFGVARLTESDPDLTVSQTHAGQVIGTIAYMSPEQLGGDPLAVDARSDVYSLGVLTFELLTGALPFDLDGKLLHEAARVIRDVEPRRLSSLSRILRGDVETIVAKAMEKDPARRYQSASELAADLRRLLRHQPIMARPPTLRYQLGKFARRHKELVAGLVLVGVVLIAAIVTVSVQLASALRSADAARRESRKAEAATEYLRDVLASATPGMPGGGCEVRLADVLDRAAGMLGETMRGQPELELQARWTLGNGYLSLGEYAAAEEHFTRALELARELDGPDSRESLLLTSQLARVLSETYRESHDLVIPALDAARKAFGPNHEVTRELLWRVAVTRAQRGEPAEALTLLRELQENLARTAPGDRRQPLHIVLAVLADCLQGVQDWDGAEIALREAWALFEVQPDHTILFSWKDAMLGYTLQRQGWSAQAEQWFRRTLDVQKRLLEPDHPETLATYDRLADFLRYSRRADEALAIQREVLAVVEGMPSADQLGFAMIVGRVGQLLSMLGRDAEAADAFASAVSHTQRARSDDYFIAHAWWRESMIRTGYGLHREWASESLRWHGCRALDDALRAAPTGTFDQDELRWETLRFTLGQWMDVAGAEPQLVVVDEGDLEALRARAEPPPGLYRLSISVARQGGPAVETSAWALLAPWELRLYHALAYCSSQRDRWESLMATEPRATRSLPSLCLANWWDSGFGPGNTEEYFAVAATTTIDLPPGEYLCVATVDDGAQVMVDGEEILESWTDLAWGFATTIEAPLTLSRGSHRIRVGHFQIVGDARLWLRLVPMSQSEAAVLPGPQR
jgi:tetratricopeptide (TPR) repeat protein